jgi:hypothetical protein
MAQADFRSDMLDGHFWAKAVVGADIWLWLAICRSRLFHHLVDQLEGIG